MKIPWTPLAPHVSQIHPQDGSGWDDCWQASLLRYAYEKRVIPLSTSIAAGLDLISRASRGSGDSLDNSTTDLPEAARSLDTLGIVGYQWTTSYRDLLAAQVSILLVDGRSLSPAQYPASWFGAAPGANHFILWLPQYQGNQFWFNDPLAYSNGQHDCTYWANNVAAATYGGYILPPLTADATPPHPIMFTQDCAVKTLADHARGTVLARPHHGDSGVSLDWQARGPQGDLWQRVRYRSFEGWVPTTVLAH